ncbi:MAG: S-adenosylmethionine synthase [Chlamydiae bacterium]|nr:S-adenosylmethionine synthase [Chlamydiota bacterium]
MKNYLFTSESVAIGHPDKIADQISDAILDACLREDPDSKVACETMVSTGLVILGGEITTKALFDYQDVVRETIKKIGYCDSALGFDYRSCGVIRAINKQSEDIALGVEEGKGLYQEQGAGDQGIMFGYACDETPELMPMPIMFVHHIMKELQRLREENILPYLRPDGKAQVTVEYNDQHVPQRIHTVVIGAQHSEDVDLETITKDMKDIVYRIAPAGFVHDKTRFLVNPSGRFVIGGPVADCGLTGRKTIVDTYGGMARHGGGAFSGKDPSKVDRSAAYAARYVAKNIVAAKLAKKCEVQVSYALGVADPISIKVDTFGTGSVSEDELSEAIFSVFDLSPKGINEMLDLKRPIYFKTAFGGHFGREEEAFTWERTNRVEQLQQILGNRLLS